MTLIRTKYNITPDMLAACVSLNVHAKYAIQVDYLDLLNKSVRARKVAITKAIQAETEHYNDIRKAIKQGDIWGWLHGEKVFIGDLDNTKYEIEKLQSLYKLI